MPKHPDLDKRISVQVEGNLPDFIRSDNTTFIQFMRAYYEWMEEEGNPYEVLGNLKHYQDIDRTINDFVKYFKNEFIQQIPESILADKEFTVKKIREFYRERGTEESFKLFFRLLFNDNNVSFRYPGLEILRLSDGRWVKENFIRVFFDSNSFDMVGQEITGLTSGSSAVVESLVKFNIGSDEVGEGLISNIKGEFQGGETISFTDINGNSLTQVIGGVVSNITVDDGGKDYMVGDVVDVADSNVTASVSLVSSGNITGYVINNGGSNYVIGDYLVVDNTNKLDVDGLGVVLKVSGVSGGSITSLEIENPGRNYIDLPTVDGTTFFGIGLNADIDLIADLNGIKEISVESNGFNVTSPPSVSFGSASGTGAVGTAVVSGQYQISNGRWLGTDSFISSDKVFQDNDFFQDFSYVVKAGQGIEKWRDFILKTLHPAGMKVFGQVSIGEILNLDVSVVSGGYRQTIIFPVVSPEDSSVYLDLAVTDFYRSLIVFRNTSSDDYKQGGNSRLNGISLKEIDRNKLLSQGGLGQVNYPLSPVTTGTVTSLDFEVDDYIDINGGGGWNLSQSDKFYIEGTTSGINDGVYTVIGLDTIVNTNDRVYVSENITTQQLAESGTIQVSTNPVRRLVITNGGSGYTSATVSVNNSGTGGSGLTATATVNTGAVVGLTITNSGSGYNIPPLITINGDGSGATGFATISSANLGNFASLYGDLTLNDFNNNPNKMKRYVLDAYIEIQRQ